MEFFNEFANSFKDTSDGITSPFGYLYSVVAILGVRSNSEKANWRKILYCLRRSSYKKRR